MSSLKYRCNGKTTGGTRCKKHAEKKGGFCYIHSPKTDATLEVDQLVFEPGPSFFTDGETGSEDKHLCGHPCNLTLEKCCDCTDLRPSSTPKRHVDYCKICKARLEVLNNELHPVENRNYLVFNFPHENPEDAIAFNMFIAYYQERLRR